MREPEIETQTYFLLRFWRQKKSGKIDVLYAYNRNGYRERREWGHRSGVKCAYRFETRSDAMSAKRSPAFEDLLKGRKKSYYSAGEQNRYLDTRYFWEIVKVTETITRDFEEEVLKSNAPAMLQLAKEL